MVFLRRRSRTPSLLLMILAAGLIRPSSARKMNLVFETKDRRLKASTCTLTEALCTVNPAITFQHQQSTVSLADRLYQLVMAQHILCPQHISEKECTAASSKTCAWNYQQQRCEADTYASYLLPLSCPGSKARAYLRCMQKANAATCIADQSCTAESAGNCYPRSMIAAAHKAKVSMQAAAEDTALAIVTGDLKVLGSCAGAQVLQQLAWLCPFSSNRGCSKQHCTYDVPPFIPRRPQQHPNQTVLDSKRGNRSGSHGNDSSGMRLVTHRPGLPYYGSDPAPFCAIDVVRLPALLHQVIDVSQGIQAAIAAAESECQAADTVVYTVHDRAATCGHATFQYSISSVLKAADTLQG